MLAMLKRLGFTLIDGKSQLDLENVHLDIAIQGFTADCAGRG
jgi:hypothetical protein